MTEKTYTYEEYLEHFGPKETDESDDPEEIARRWWEETEMIIQKALK